ncbi:MAG TPA: rod shape-determining protein [Candidatus Aphodocola excrementigallinarum]|uniref:Cell shape-determining protein MreB n=1 Tax=Candidatus Aphodocola excrementigallinarum TaxID=2840670 RepID=A0A9D1INQ4_9FIRM|nr:rod shape-determining protein [Candidatus Aphodocola excrementigallinarum]
MRNKDIGIDLGTANILIYVKGEGIVLCEPSVVAIDKDSGKVLAIGKKAHDMLGRTPGSVIAIRPLKDGVIADFDKTEIMLDYFIKKIKGRTIFSRPRIVICCPSNITQVEKNAIREVAERTGAKKVYVEEEPKVAAVGAGLEISSPSGNMVIDIGGGTTDIAVLSLNGIVYSESIKVAGNTFDVDIIKYIKNKYKLLVGEVTAEKIKIKIGTVLEKEKEKKMQVRGRDLINGLPKTITITSSEVKEAIKDSVYMIIHGAKMVLEKIEPEISADIIENGIVLTGGGALIEGLDKLIEKELKVPTKIADSPLTCVAEGTGIILDSLT